MYMEFETVTKKINYDKLNSQIKEPDGLPNIEKPIEIDPIDDPKVPKEFPEEVPKNIPVYEPSEKPPFEVPKPAEFVKSVIENKNGFSMRGK